MQLSEAQQRLALHLFEAITDPLSHSDIRKALIDQLDDSHPGEYCCVCDVYGDDSSGDVVYQHGNQLFKAPYSLGTTNGKRTAEIDEDSKTNVVPHTTYEEEADDDDSYASMESDRKQAKLYTSLPAYERFIAKSERDAADASDFAGKGKSYPILKPGDIMAAVRSMGRAGSDNVGTATLKKNIIAIAKRKGWTKYLPKAWQGGGSDASEARRTPSDSSTLRLCETSVASLEKIVIREARADYPIKLIAPGAGSSAFYPAEVLKRDGPIVFKAGTHVYVNHPTAAEEAARPEGDVKNLAGVLTTAAEWQESGAKGPGLYARMKVFADHGQMVEEKAPHVGMSIRASGVAESGKRHNGLPILKELTSAESVDVVTRAGAGGMILKESGDLRFRFAESEDREADEMTAADVKRLVESAVAPFRAKANRGEAKERAFELLESVSLPQLAKQRIVERVIESLDLTGDAFDEKALEKALISEARAEGEYLASVTGSGRVIGMGSTSAEPVLKKKEAKRLKEAEKEDRREATDIFEELMGGDRKIAKIAVKGRVA